MRGGHFYHIGLGRPVKLGPMGREIDFGAVRMAKTALELPFAQLLSHNRVCHVPTPSQARPTSQTQTQ